MNSHPPPASTTAPWILRYRTSKYHQQPNINYSDAKQKQQNKVKRNPAKNTLNNNNNGITETTTITTTARIETFEFTSMHQYKQYKHLNRVFIFHPIRPLPKSLEEYQIQQVELAEIKQFNSDLFPVRYQQPFYDNLMNDNVLTILGRERRGSGRLVAMACARLTQERIILLKETTTEPQGFKQTPEVLNESDSEDGEEKESTALVKLGYIMTLGVRKEYQGNGIGSFLLMNLTQKLLQMGAEVVGLDVMIGNTRAISMYKRHGYQQIMHRKNYYLINGNHYDAVHMQYRP